MKYLKSQEEERFSSNYMHLGSMEIRMEYFFKNNGYLQ